MGLGCCCSGEFCKRHGSSGTFNYMGSPATAVHKYLNDQKFASRVSQTITSSGSYPANFTYDLKANHKYLVASCGSAGAYVYNVAEGISMIAQIGGGHAGGEDQYFHGRRENVTYWAGNSKGMRYGFDNFSGAYGAEFYKEDVILTALGTYGIGYYDIENNIEYTILNQLSTIAYKVGVLGDYLLIGTCGYTPPTSNENLEEQPELTQFPPSQQGRGLLIYDLSRVGYGGTEGFVKSISCGNVTDMASDRKNKIAYIATDSGAFKLEFQKSANQNADKFKQTSIVSGICTAIDFYEEDSYVAIAGSDGFSGSVCKNGSTIIELNKKVGFCTDPEVFCLDFETWSFYDGGFAAKQVNYDSPVKRVAEETCNTEIDQTPETLGTFPTGLAAGEGGLVVSSWNAGFAYYSLDGEEGWNIANLLTEDLDCNSWIRRDGPFGTEYDVNPEYTLACGPAAVGCGRTFISDSVQFNLAGKGPGYYNPVLETTKNAYQASALIHGFGLFSGIIHF